MIYIKLTETMFKEEFNAVRPGSFTDAGLSALFCYLDDSDDWELDVIAICCEFTQYDSIEAACFAYGMTDEELEDNTLVLRADDGSVVMHDF